jgi:hypothetical protein
MFNSTVLDVAIGLIFVYLLLGLMCTTVNEWIAGIMKLRAKKLEEGIRRLLKDPTFVESFYAHPLTRSLIPKSDGPGPGQEPKTHPSYVPARTFALAVMDIANPATSGPTDFATLMEGIRALPDSAARTSLLALMQNIDARLPGALTTAQQRVEDWFNDAMDRVSGAYKRRAQINTIIVASVITILSNADTVQIANQLFLSPALRDSVVAAAKERAAGPRPLSTLEYTDPANPVPTPPAMTAPGEGVSDSGALTAKQREMLGQLSGWSAEFRKFNEIAKPACTTDCGAFPGLRLITEFGTTVAWFWMVVPMHLVGWILTAIAVSLGAPFWFDTLNRFMNIRAAGRSPDENPKGPEKRT